MRQARGFARQLAAAAVLLAGWVTGSSASATTIDWVTVGNINNPTSAAGGSVAYEYRIMKYEFTNDQFVAFLNAVDPFGSNPQNIYSTSMGTDDRGGISRDLGAASGSKYAARTNMGNKPVNFVSWFSAARVANWLHNGGLTYQATDSSATAPQNQGAYNIGTATTTSTGVTASTLIATKQPDAKYSLPTPDEFVKAGFYDPTLNSGAGGYWNVAMRSNSGWTSIGADATGNGLGTLSSNTGNWGNAADWNGLDGNVTTVGTNGRASYYGTFDQSGNVWELTDQASGTGNVNTRAGGYASTSGNALNISSVTARPVNDANQAALGFRLVSPVPEPGTLGLAGGGAVVACGLAALRRRRRVGRLA